MAELTGPIQHKRDTSGEWAASTIPLRAGEIGIDTTVRRMKIGDGATLWPALKWQDVAPADLARFEAAAAALEGAVTPTDAVNATLIGNEASQTRQALNTTIAAVAGEAVGAVSDAVGEWWIDPILLHDPDNRRYVGTGISARNANGKADVVVYEMTYSGRVRRYAIAELEVDDHNVANISLLPWGGVLVTYNNHNVDNFFRAKVSNAAGDLVTLVGAAEYTSNVGFPISYGQMHLIEHLTTDDVAVFWDFVRLYRGDGWAWEVLEVTVTRAGVITRSSPKRFLSGRTNQAYTTTAMSKNAEGQQVIRAVLGFNPSADVHSLHAFEVNVVTGEITSLTDGPVGNISTPAGVPIFYDASTPLVADVAAGRSRRLFYTRPGPGEWAILHADWDKATPDAAQYVARVRNPGSGMQMAAGGYVSVPYSSALDVAASGGGEALIGVKLGVTSISGNRELSRRRASGTERQFQFEVTPAGNLQLTEFTRILSGSPTAADFVSTAAVPNIFTSEVSVKWRWRHNGTVGVIQFFYSTDLGASWTQLGADVTTGGATTLANPNAPLLQSSTVDQVALTLQAFSYFSWDGTTETELVGIDWRTKTDPTATSFAGNHGETWTPTGTTQLLGGWVLSNLGIAGPRVGFNPGANYIGGMAFTSPANTDDCILVARRNPANTESTVERWVPNGAQFVYGETLAKSEHFLGRPMPPRGGGFVVAGYSEITEYAPDNFADYEGNIRIVS